MALYNQIVFVLLCLEILAFVLLIIPLPFTWRRRVFRAIATSPIIARLQYVLKIMFIFVGILFIDAVQRMIKVQQEGLQAKDRGTRGDIRSESDWRSRKFLAERNFYLTGFTLFLSLILSRTYSLVLELIQIQEDLAHLKSKGAPKGSDGQAQLKQLQKEYDELSAKYAQATSAVSNKKVD